MGAITKVCTRCSVEKSLDDFSPKKGYRLGRDAQCKPCINVYVRSVRHKYRTPESHAADMRRWRQENPEAARALDKRKRENNPERVSELKRASYEKKPEHYAATSAAWRLANPDRVESYHAKRRGATHSERLDRLTVWERDGGICGICQEPADPDNWHLDHVIPLSRGGDHTFANTQVSHPRCNLKKGARLPSAA